MVAMKSECRMRLEEKGDWFAKATVGHKWGMAAQWLFIPLTVLFLLPEIFWDRACETWHTLYSFYFFTDTHASKCAPSVTTLEGPR
jgi:hypothetical protein